MKSFIENPFYRILGKFDSDWDQKLGFLYDIHFARSDPTYELRD